MLINWAYGKPSDEEREKLLKALGVPDDLCNPLFPLPNMKRSSEKEFWGWNASYSPRARIWLGSQTIAYQHANILIYWMGEVHPSFAVAVIYKNTVADRAVYYRWSACDHDFKITASGHCWRDYTCTKCGVTDHEDSSG
ncbi:hypothetical protein ACVILK_000649 [Bradyrhizobium embrapense]